MAAHFIGSAVTRARYPSNCLTYSAKHHRKLTALFVALPWGERNALKHQQPNDRFALFVGHLLPSQPVWFSHSLSLCPSNFYQSLDMYFSTYIAVPEAEFQNTTKPTVQLRDRLRKNLAPVTTRHLRRLPLMMSHIKVLTPCTRNVFHMLGWILDTRTDPSSIRARVLTRSSLQGGRESGINDRLFSFYFHSKK